MKAALVLLFACGCAMTPKVPIEIYPVQTTLTADEINVTYSIAQREFESATKCAAPKSGLLIITDSSLVDLNRGRNIFVGGGMLSLVVAHYTPDNLIQIEENHPDKPQALFHELLHFMFVESKNCREFAEDVRTQHVIADFLLDTYLLQTGHVPVGNEWLIRELERLGLKVH